MDTTVNIMRPKFALKRHALITQGAAATILTKDEIQVVVNANLTQDLRQVESRIHFDNCAFKEGSLYIEKQWEMIDSDGDRRSSSSLSLFGRLLHTVQDFYAHSNWVEIHLNEALIPLWDLQVKSLPAGIMSGTWVIGEPKKCSPGTPDHDELNKDEPSSKAGSKIVDRGPHQGKTLYELAEEVAIRATRQQLERLVQTALAPMVKLPKVPYSSLKDVSSLLSVLASWTQEAQQLREIP